MLLDKNTSIHLSCQQFDCDSFETSETETRLKFISRQKTGDVVCPYCLGSHVHVHGSCDAELKDAPVWTGTRQILDVRLHRYHCLDCGKTFMEETCLKYPGTRITPRAANWIRELLRWHMPISAVHEITGIHWETIRNIHLGMMEEALDWRRKELQDKGYSPEYLAVDEFAVHKGHSYATCVMDLVQGDVLWVGEGRSKECFNKFFEEFDLAYLSDVKAIAMDMNASYNILVEHHLPHVEIVYDRYHMQAQFGKDVLGAVRLNEAREHGSRAKELESKASETEDATLRRQLKTGAREERRNYSRLKGSRWTLLADGESLSPEKRETLNSILDSHSDLALCYAMKEEMCDLFELQDPDIARRKWNDWFGSAKASGIPALVKFAELKEKRLEGLAAHARHSITTGKLEGFNNKIKVAKRIGYGYRDEHYFFTLIRYMAIPSVRGSSHRNP